MFAVGHARALACAEPDLGLPADGLHRGGELCQAQGPVPTDVGRIPVGPGACAEGTTRRWIAGLGHAAGLATWPPGLCGRRQAQSMQAVSGMLDAPQGTQCGHHSHGDGALDTPQSLEGLDHGSQAPRGPLLVAVECATPPPCRLGRAALDVLLQDNRQRGGGPAPRAAPAQGGRAPGGPPWIAEIMPPPESFAPSLGRRPLPPSRCPRPPQGADGVSGDGGHRDGGAVPGAHAPDQWHGITPIGFDAVAGFLRPPGGGDDPAKRSVVASGNARAPSRRGRLRRRRRVPCLATAAAGSAERSHTAGARGCPGQQPRHPVLGRQRRLRWTLAGHPCQRRACETVTSLTAEESASLWATGCGSGCGKRTRATLGLSRPIGSHYV
jgi:hypothetical protein